MDNWYLFDPDRNLAGGPVPSKQLLLPTGTLRPGWRILGTPRETVVLACGIGEAGCPGVDSFEPTRDFFYLIRYDPPAVPEMDGGDLQLEGTRSDFDMMTSEPIVFMQFTKQGAERFGEITRREARSRQTGLAPRQAGRRSMRHFAIVLDRRDQVVALDRLGAVPGRNQRQATAPRSAASAIHRRRRTWRLSFRPECFPSASRSNPAASAVQSGAWPGTS